MIGQVLTSLQVDDIATFEDLNKICIFVYTISPENKIIKDKDGNGKYIANRVALLRIEDHDDNSHYVYIKHTDRLLNAHTHACDTGNKTCFCVSFCVRKR